MDPVDLVTQKTVSRKISMACGHTQRIRLRAPEEPLTLPQFDDWVATAFQQRSTLDCPTCAAVVQAKALDEQERALLGSSARYLDAFADEPVAVASFARTVRLNYLNAVHDVFDDEKVSPFSTSVLFMVVRAWLARDVVGEQQARARAEALLRQYLCEEAGKYQSKFWVTKANRGSMLALAKKHVRQPEMALSALVASSAGYSTMGESYRAMRALLADGTEADVSVLAGALEVDSTLRETLDYMMLLRALGT